MRRRWERLSRQGQVGCRLENLRSPFGSKVAPMYLQQANFSIWTILSIWMREKKVGRTFNKAKRNLHLDSSLCYLKSTKLISIIIHYVEIRHRNRNYKRHILLLLNF